MSERVVAKRRPRVRTGSLSFGSLEVTVNGKTVRCSYSRVEYSDGSYEETGLPAGCPSKPTLLQLYEHLKREALS